MPECRKIVLAVLLISGTLLFAQRVLVDDAPMCGWHDRYTYQALWDTLISAGCTVDFTSIVGRYPDLSSYDFVVLMHHAGCASAGFTDSQKEQLINFVCSGGQILIMPMGDIEPLNDLLCDPRWNTGVRLTFSSGPTHTACIAPFPPLTDGIEYLNWGVDAELLVNPPAYPFVWDDACERVLAAVSYPQGMGDYECDPCETGGRIIVIGENHTYEYEVVGYVEPMSYRFIANILTALAGVGDSLDPCQPPEGIPRLDSIPCASPGEVAHIYGDNIPPDANLYFDGAPISFTWVDSTEITFAVPSDAEQGYHTVTVEVDGRQFRIQIQVYCDWLEISSFGLDCADIGDTVWFYGGNFSLSATMTFGGAPVSDFQIVSDTSGWFVVPDTAGLEEHPSIGQSYRYQVCIENAPTQRDCAWFRVPCPCPPDSEIEARIENLRFWERTDGTDTVYIVYDLIADTAQNVVLWCSSDGGATWDVPCTTLSGAVGSGVEPGESLVIAWDAGTDVPDTEGSDWVFRIEITDTTVWINDTVSYFAVVVGGDTTDEATSLAQTSDSGYILAGYTRSFGAGAEDLLVIKVSKTGTVQWAKTVGGSEADYGYSLTPTNDGGFVVVGMTQSFGIGGKDLFIVKFDSTGLLEWARTIGGPYNDDWGKSVIQTYDGNFVVAGTFDRLGTGNIDMFIAKLTSSGSLEWAYTVGGSNRDGANSVIQTIDGGFAVVGGTWSFGAGLVDIFFVKFNSLGSLEWARSIGSVYLGMTHLNIGYSLVQMQDSSFVISGRVWNPGIEEKKLLIARFDSDGRLEWARTVGGVGGESGRAVIQVSDSDFVVSGYTRSFGGGFDDFFLTRFTLTGSLQWATAAGRIFNEYANAVIYTYDGELAVAGSFCYALGATAEDFAIVKFDINGNSCIGEKITPVVTNAMPTVRNITPTVTEVTPTILDVTPIVIDVTPLEDIICEQIAFCPFGAVYAAAESDPGPIDTRCPRVSAACPPDGEVGEATTINWTVEDSFIPPNTLAPAFPIEIYFSSDGGANWDFVGTSDNSGSFEWVYPSVITSNAYIMVCATDSFGHTCCDTCGPFTITGDTVSPWGYAYADTCSPADVFFILHDDEAIDWSSVCIQDPLGVLCYPDNMRLLGNDTLIFYPRLPDSMMDPTRYFYIRLWSATDSSGNEISEMLVDSALTIEFRHPCYMCTLEVVADTAIEICHGEILHLCISTPGYDLSEVNIEWNPPDYIISESGNCADIYPDTSMICQVVASYEPSFAIPAPCVDTLTVRIAVSYCECARRPNPFTPNGDGINDFCQFTFPGMGTQSGIIYIYDTENIEVRRIEVPANSKAKQIARWDGKDNSGNPVPQGVYLYVIESAGKIVCNGTVTVAR